MTDANQYLGKLVIARTAQGAFQFVGKCVAYCDAPTVTVNQPDGTQAHWRADMVEVLEVPQEVIAALLPDKQDPFAAARAALSSLPKTNRSPFYEALTDNLLANEPELLASAKLILGKNGEQR